MCEYDKPKVLTLDLGNTSQYSVNGSKDKIVEVCKGKFDIKKYINFVKNLLMEEELAEAEIVIVYESGAGIMSKSSNRNFGKMEAIVETIASQYNFETIPVHITWKKAYKDEPKELDAQNLYKYAIEKGLVM